jgi:hypothetical protein
VEIDAVEIEAGLLGRNREAGAVDEAAQILGVQPELVRQLAAFHARKILDRQAAEAEV